MGSWILIMACSGDEPAWKAALEDDPSSALEACRSLEGNAGAECAFGVLRTNNMVSAENCELLDPGPYQNECRFAVAEIFAVDGRHAEAAEKCKQAGDRFERSCYQHCWFRAADLALAVADETGPSAASKAILEEAMATYGKDLKTPEAVVYEAFWWAWWERGQPIDLSTCPDELCVQASLVAAQRYAWVAGCEGDASAHCVGEDACLEALEAGREVKCQKKERPGSPKFNPPSR